jgi:hypothetical protein
VRAVVGVADSSFWNALSRAVVESVKSEGDMTYLVDLASEISFAVLLKFVSQPYRSSVKNTCASVQKRHLLRPTARRAFARPATNCAEWKQLYIFSLSAHHRLHSARNTAIAYR